MRNRLAIERVGAYAAGVGATAILLGYFFEIGFISGLDGRLLQFLAVQDYLVVSAQYIFPFFAIFLALGVANFGQVFAAHHTFPGMFKRDRSTEEINRFLRRSGFFIIGIAGILVVGAIALIAYSKLVYPIKTLNDDEAIFHGVTELIGGVAVFCILLSQLDFPRKFEILVPIALVAFVVACAFFYGELEGEFAFQKRDANVVIGLIGGQHLNVILLQRISAGIVYRAAKDNAVYFIPDSQIVYVKLFGNTRGESGWIF